MKVCRRGTSVWSRASVLTSSSEGPTSMPPPARSAATAIEDLEGLRDRQAARGHQHAQVVEHVGGLLAHALVRLLARRAHDLLGLLLDLLADPCGVGQELCRVAGTGVARLRALRDR